MRALVIALSLAACTQSAPPAQTPPSAQTPQAIEGMRLTAHGLGPVRIGMPIEEADDLLGLLQGEKRGNPDDPDDPLCSEWVDYRGLHVVAINGKVSSVDITRADRGIRTPEGIGIGSSAAEVLAAYPGAERWESEMYPEPGHELRVPGPEEGVGMSFGIGEDGRVAEIQAGSYYGCAVE